MTFIEKIQPNILAYGLAIAIFFLILSGYGKQAIEWIAMKLYEFFIQRNAMK